MCTGGDTEKFRSSHGDAVFSQFAEERGSGVLFALPNRSWRTPDTGPGTHWHPGMVPHWPLTFPATRVPPAVLKRKN